MSIIDHLKKPSIPVYATFRISQAGEEKLKNYSGDVGSRILSTLDSGGSMNVMEISRAAALSRGQVERTLPSLVRGGYVTYISGVSTSG